MKSAVETLNPTRVRLTVEVPFDELKPSLDAAYKKIAGSVNVPGFRKGKVPPRIIDQRFGRAVVLDEAVNAALPRFYTEAVQAAELEPLGQPEVDVTKFTDGEQLEFTAEVDVRPEIVLPDYSGIAVTVDDAEVTDEDIATQLAGLLERFATFEGVDRAAADGDYLSIDLSGRNSDGEEIEDAQASGLSYVVGAGNLVEGIDEAVIGLSAGESTTFASKLVAGPRKDEEIDIKVTVNSVKVRELPELDDEFAQSASQFDSAEELKADASERIGRQKVLAQGGQARDKVLEALLEQVEVPLPEAYLHAEIHFRQDTIANQLEQAGLSLDAYLQHEGQSKEEFDAEVTKRATEAMKAQFVLDAVAKKEEVEISQEEITRHLIQRAQSSGLSPDQFAQQIVESGQANMLVAEAVRGKALAVLLTTAVITDASGRPVDLEGLRVDGIGANADGEAEGGSDLDDPDVPVEPDDSDNSDTGTVAAAAPVGGAASISIPAAPGA